MTYAQTAMLIVAAAVLGIVLLIGLIAEAVRRKKNTASAVPPLSHYFIGGKTTGGFGLAMTVLALYFSAGTFLGGPGYAYEKGLGWAFLSIVQIPGLFLALAIVSKRLGIASRMIGGVTVNDVLRARYESKALVILTSVLSVFFFILQMIAQLKGAAILFQTITGTNYETALLIFGALLVLFTALGGFSAQSASDTLLGILMVIGSLILLTTLTRASGNGSVAETMTVLHPGWDSVRGADGTLTFPYALSFWLLMGLGVLAFPQTAVCGTAYRSTRSLHRAIVISLVLVSFIVTVVHVVGAYSPLLISMAEVKVLLGAAAGTDYVIPAVILKYCNPLTAGLFFAAPLAAVLSRVNALLLSGSAALIKDVYVNYLLKETGDAYEQTFRRKLIPMTLFLTILFFAGAWLLLRAKPFAAMPIMEIELLAIGGLETVLFYPLFGCIFRVRLSTAGAIASVASGCVLYVVLSILGIRIYGFLPIVPAFLLGGFAYLIGALYEKYRGVDVKTLLPHKKQ